jgi:crossover junction endodeoxyribonuclease RuvC
MLRTNNPSIILGIDPGIADTGYGVILKDGNHKLSCIDYGSIKTDSKTEFGERLLKINLELEKIIKKYKPDLISVEQLFFANNVKTALIVGQARGVVMLTAKQSNVVTVEFTPLQVKQAVSSYGAASKTQVQKMVKLLLDLDHIPKSDDAADALAIAICAANNRITSQNA